MPTTPTPAPAAPTAVPATSVASATLSPTRRRTTRPAPSPRIVYTRHATAGDSDDCIVASALVVFYKIMAWGGGVAILAWIIFGGFKWGRATALPAPAPRVIERIIERSAPAPVVRPTPSPRELTPEERAEQYKEERRRQYGIR